MNLAVTATPQRQTLRIHQRSAAYIHPIDLASDGAIVVGKVGHEKLPDWFVEHDLHLVAKQPDQDRLIERAEKLWGINGITPDDLVKRNRAHWYRAVAMVRTTKMGWHLDRAVNRLH